MKRNTLIYAAVPLALAAGALVAGPAAAAGPNCRSATTTLTNRADSGLHGDWASDDITRTVTICETPAQVPAAATTSVSTYLATVVDKGTFTTVAGKSPNAGVVLAAGLIGHVGGGYTATFTAESAFKNYKATLDGKTYSGTQGPATGDWVKTLWGGTDFTSVADLIDWKWTYWTCSVDVAKATEKWVNAEAGNSGDITGTACPSPSPSASASASASAPVVVIPSAPAGAGGGGGTLPITGSQTALYAGGAIVLLAAGAGLILVSRRRRDSNA